MKIQPKTLTRRAPAQHALLYALVLTAAVLAAAAAYANEPQADATATELNTAGQVYASPGQVKLVQQKLRETERTPGPVDGVWGEKTMEEVRDFQRANGLTPTGRLNTSLLNALELGYVLKGRTESGEFLGGLLEAESSSAAADGEAALGAPIFVSPEHVAQIQHVLREAGHYSGEIDGVWGESTAAAANKYRRENALEAQSGVDIALLRALNREVKSAPQLSAEAAARAEGAPLLAGPAAVRALQRQLSERGHEPGDVDGLWGENTREALRAFQSDRELETTGTLTLPTLAALGVDIADRPGRQSALDAAPRDEEDDEDEAEQQ